MPLHSLRPLITLIAAVSVGVTTSGCALLITAAQVSGKMPDTASVVSAAVRTARGLTATQQPEMRTIAAGEAVTGTLTEEHEQLEDGSYFVTWFYSGSQGERVQIDLWSDDFEPYLIVGFMEGGLEGSFEQLAAAGEEGAGEHARLELALQYSGTYAIVVNSLQPEHTGAYRLRVMNDGGQSEMGPEVEG